MKYFVQFLTLSSGQTFKDGKMINVEKFPIEAMGSDGVYILDGRNSLETMKDDAKNRIEKLKNVQSYLGFKIMRGERFTNCKEVYNSMQQK
jgi:hypothetical protein